MSRDSIWLQNVRGGRSATWSAESGRCMSCLDSGRSCRFGITAEWATADGLAGQAVLGAEHEGGPEVAHGGVIAGLFDELLGHVALSRDRLVVTRTLTVDYLRPVPIGRGLRLSARIEGQEDRSWQVSGTIRLRGVPALLATARGEWREVPDTHYERHRAWLKEINDEAATGPLCDAGSPEN